MLLLLALGCWDTEPPLAAHCTLARTVSIRTADGATAALHHHPGEGPPVLLVHGISSNHRFFDLDAEHSLADWLAARGHDAWLLDLRGHGAAEVDADGRAQRAGWRLDDYRHDVGAAVDHVRACTGYATVGYVGHSMGGMVGTVYATSGGADALASVVYLGSPGTFSREAELVPLAQAGMAAGGATLASFDTPALAEVAADLGRARVRLALAERLYNPENLEPATVERMFRSIVSPVARGEMAQFARMIRRERFTSWDGSVDYLAALGEVTVPALVVVGMADRIAVPAWVEAHAAAFGGPTEVFRAGREGGLGADYGHLDLALGERADEEIFPRIAAWLAAHPPRRSVPAGR